MPTLVRRRPERRTLGHRPHGRALHARRARSQGRRRQLLQAVGELALRSTSLRGGWPAIAAISRAFYPRSNPNIMTYCIPQSSEVVPRT